MSVRLGNFSQAFESLNGVPTFLGQIVATTTKNNHDTAVPFYDVAATNNGLAGRILLIQPDAACYVLPGTVNTTTVTTANGVKMAADEKLYVMMGSTYSWLAAVAVSGTANVRVWELV